MTIRLNRRIWIRYSARAAWPLFLVLMSFASASSVPLNVGDKTQLFCDDWLIADTVGVTLVVNPPECLGPVMIPDKPWEGRTLSYLSVLEDGGVYKMWYGAYEGPSWNYHICYATSPDGINWTKPNLGLVDFQGSTDNNILAIDFDDGGAIFIDSQAPPQSRYKILGIRPVPYIYESPDGLNFTLVDTALMDLMPDSHNQIFFDRRLRTYVAYLRSWNFLPDYDSGAVPNRTVSRIEIVDPLSPWPYMPLDTPFYRFGIDNPAAISTELDVVMALDSLDPPDADIYNPCVNQYEFADDTYFSFSSLFYHYPEPPIGSFYSDGILRSQLAFSRDGIGWTRFRTPYVDNNLCGDSLRQMYMGLGILRIGDSLYQYLYGDSQTHGDSVFFSTYFCLRQRLHGFVSLDAADSIGTILTRQFMFTGNSLQLNYTTQAGGYLIAELINSSGEIITGFSLADSDTLRGDNLTGVVTWQSSPDIRWLEDSVISLRIEMKMAKLFSLRFVNDPILSVGEEEKLPSGWELRQNYPNPFNPTTTIAFTMPVNAHVRIEVLDILGRHVCRLLDDWRGQGSHTVRWDGVDEQGREVASGIYFYRFTSDDFVKTGKMELVK